MNIDESVIAKWEIVHHEQFLLLPQSFQMFSTADLSKCVCKWKRVKADN